MALMVTHPVRSDRPVSDMPLIIMRPMGSGVVHQSESVGRYGGPETGTPISASIVLRMCDFLRSHLSRSNQWLWFAAERGSVA